MSCSVFYYVLISCCFIGFVVLISIEVAHIKRDPNYRHLTSTGIGIGINLTTAPSIQQTPCPIRPHGPLGPIPVDQNWAGYWTSLEEYVESTLASTRSSNVDGHFRPAECTARHRVAVILPYRNREIHLKLFLRHMIPFLNRQKLDFKIFVVEPDPEYIEINRALLKNVGFLEANKNSEWDCVIFHDVDLLPENDENSYECRREPTHLSVYINSMNYKLRYPQMFGGVVMMTTKQFSKINGYSNVYVGWGAEDDDLYKRVTVEGYRVTRPRAQIARYKMLLHPKDTQNFKNLKLLKYAPSRFGTDGLNNLKYRVLSRDEGYLFTKILVTYDQREIFKTSLTGRNSWLAVRFRLGYIFHRDFSNSNQIESKT